MKAPETKFALSGDVSIAYQVVGNGPLDVVMIPGFISHVEFAWEDPSFDRFLTQLSSFCRLILLDKRGSGLSDRVEGIPTLEERMDDVRAVMDATGTERAALFGVSEGGPMSILFAATYPERTSALILYGSIAKGSWAPDYPWGMDLESEWFKQWIQGWRNEWGSPYGIEYQAPSKAKDEEFRHWFAKFLRLSSSPSAVIKIFEMNCRIDVRPILQDVRVPTLVLHRTGDQTINIEQGRYLADHIPGAKFVELEGEDHLWWVGDTESIVSESQEFLTGDQPIPQIDRVLATVLFTDIVDSTKKAAELGDQKWKDLLGTHNTILEREIERYRGRVVKNTGDGYLATFDGPGRAIRCGSTVREALDRLGIQIRAGIHIGEIDIVDEDIGGITVNIAARILSEAKNKEVWVSRTVKDLVVGSEFEFIDKGTHDLKGVPGEWDLYAVEA